MKCIDGGGVRFGYAAACYDEQIFASNTTSSDHVCRTYSSLNDLCGRAYYGVPCNIFWNGDGSAKIMSSSMRALRR